MSSGGPSRAMQEAAILAITEELEKRPPPRGAQSKLAADMDRAARERGDEGGFTQQAISQWVRTRKIGWGGIHGLCAFLRITPPDLLAIYGLADTEVAGSATEKAHSRQHEREADSKRGTVGGGGSVGRVRSTTAVKPDVLTKPKPSPRKPR